MRRGAQYKAIVLKYKLHRAKSEGKCKQTGHIKDSRRYNNNDHDDYYYTSIMGDKPNHNGE